jgi:hypothetical protein
MYPNLTLTLGDWERLLEQDENREMRREENLWRIVQRRQKTLIAKNKVRVRVRVMVRIRVIVGIRVIVCYVVYKMDGP